MYVLYSYDLYLMTDLQAYLLALLSVVCAGCITQYVNINSTHCIVMRVYILADLFL